MATHTEKIADKQEELRRVQEELEFLTDSGSYYELTLGSGTRNVYVPDLTTTSLVRTISTDDHSKFNQPWYQNYQGFPDGEEAVAIETASYVRAWSQLQKIHRNLYPELYTPSQKGNPDLTQTANNAFKWVIRYDVTGNFFFPFYVGNAGESPLTMATEFLFRGAPNATGSIEFSNEYQLYTGAAWGPITSPESDSWSADAWNAIKLMMGPLGEDAQLRFLFQVSGIAQTRFVESLT